MKKIVLLSVIVYLCSCLILISPFESAFASSIAIAWPKNYHWQILKQLIIIIIILVMIIGWRKMRKK